MTSIVIGTGAGGGMAIKTLCEAGLKVCALNSGRRLDPEKDFRNHRMSWEMKYRGFGDPQDAHERHAGYSTSEYNPGAWEHDIAYTTAPGTKWMWPRCSAVGGKTNFWGRGSARFGDIDFKAASLDGYDVDWPVTYDEIAPYYTRVEKMIGVASTVQNRPSNPDGIYLPPLNFPMLRQDSSEGRGQKGRRALFTGSNRATHRSARGASRVPLLRRLYKLAVKWAPSSPRRGSCLP